MEDASSDAPSAQVAVTIRQDLVEAQRSRGELQKRLDAVEKELEQIHLRLKAESRHLNELTAEKSTLAIRVRDRDEELRGKAKLLEVHDSYSDRTETCMAKIAVSGRT